MVKGHRCPSTSGSSPFWDFIPSHDRILHLGDLIDDQPTMRTRLFDERIIESDSAAVLAMSGHQIYELLVEDSPREMMGAVGAETAFVLVAVLDADDVFAFDKGHVVVV